MEFWIKILGAAGAEAAAGNSAVEIAAAVLSMGLTQDVFPEVRLKWFIAVCTKAVIWKLCLVECVPKDAFAI